MSSAMTPTLMDSTIFSLKILEALVLSNFLLTERHRAVRLDRNAKVSTECLRSSTSSLTGSPPGAVFPKPERQIVFAARDTNVVVRSSRAMASCAPEFRAALMRVLKNKCPACPGRGVARKLRSNPLGGAMPKDLAGVKPFRFSARKI